MTGKLDYRPNGPVIRTCMNPVCFLAVKERTPREKRKVYQSRMKRAPGYQCTEKCIKKMVCWGDLPQQNNKKANKGSSHLTLCRNLISAPCGVMISHLHAGEQGDKRRPEV